MLRGGLRDGHSTCSESVLNIAARIIRQHHALHGARSHPSWQCHTTHDGRFLFNSCSGSR